MKKLIIAVAAATVTLQVVLPMMAYAGEFYVIRDEYGNMAVTNGLPVYEWSIQSGPYSSIDAAQRATGTGKGFPWIGPESRVAPDFANSQFPQVVPRRPGQSAIVDLTP